MTQLMESWINQSITLLMLGGLFTILVKGNECNKGSNYWTSKNLLTDLCYVFLVPVLTRYVKLGFLIAMTTYVMGITTGAEYDAYFEHGYGPLAQLPIIVQAALILVISDIFLYWTHRLYHSHHLWKYHAIHHSPKVVDWLSAYRFHPINIWTTFIFIDTVMLMVGFSPKAFVLLVPFNIFYSAFVHANLNWTLGPFKTVLASPVFHRWHHTMPDEGGNKNFAPTFPILDVIFGTYYMPEGKLPQRYGVTDEAFPTHSFIGQLIYPFRK